MRAPVLAVALAAVAVGCSGDPDPTAVPTRSPVAAASVTASAGISATQARRLGLEAVAALKADRPGRALQLVAAGADVNVQDAVEDSVLLYAGAEGYAAVVEAALDHGADTRVLNRYGGTALIPACEHAHLDVIRLLLATDIEVDHVNDLGWTALGEAVALGDGGPGSQETVRLLLGAGADPNPTDRFGRTALQNAVRLGYDEVADLIRSALR